MLLRTVVNRVSCKAQELQSCTFTQQPILPSYSPLVGTAFNVNVKQRWLDPGLTIVVSLGPCQLSGYLQLGD